MAEASEKISEAPMPSEESKQDEFVDDPEKLTNGVEKSAAELLVEDIPWRDRYRQVVVTYAPLGFVAFG